MDHPLLAKSCHKFKWFAEGFRGTKQNMFAKFYPVAYLMKVLLFTIVLTVLYKKSTVLKLSLIVSIQILYILYLATTRPFISAKDSVIEILGSVFILGMFISLYWLNKSEKWTESAIYIYVTAIIIYLVAVLLISVAWLVYVCVKKKSKNTNKVTSIAKIFPETNTKRQITISYGDAAISSDNPFKQEDNLYIEEMKNN